MVRMASIISRITPSVLVSFFFLLSYSINTSKLHSFRLFVFKGSTSYK